MESLCGGVVGQGQCAGCGCGMKEDFLAEFCGEVREEREDGWLWVWRHHVGGFAG